MLKATDPFFPPLGNRSRLLSPFQTKVLDPSQNPGVLGVSSDLWHLTGYLHGTLTARAVEEMLPVNLRVWSKTSSQVSSIQAIF